MPDLEQRRHRQPQGEEQGPRLPRKALKPERQRHAGRFPQRARPGAREAHGERERRRHRREGHRDRQEDRSRQERASERPADAAEQRRPEAAVQGPEEEDHGEERDEHGEHHLKPEGRLERKEEEERRRGVEDGVVGIGGVGLAEREIGVPDGKPAALLREAQQQGADRAVEAAQIAHVERLAAQHRAWKESREGGQRQCDGERRAAETSAAGRHRGTGYRSVASSRERTPGPGFVLHAEYAKEQGA